MSRRVLDPLERTSEVLFGIIMVLTFTGSLRVAEAGREDLRTVLAGAIGCNLAWGVVDAAMYVMGSFMARARLLATVKALGQARGQETVQNLMAGVLPAELSSVLTLPEVETLRQRFNQQAASSRDVTLTRADFVGAIGVFLLVFASTFPIVVPLIVVRDTRLALALSNAVAVGMLFALGWRLGRYVGRPGWRFGLGLVLVGSGLVAITMALGG